MNLSRNMLEKLSKEELINLIEQCQNKSEQDITLYFKKIFTDAGINNGNTKLIFSVKRSLNVLYITWEKLTPSGYGDNGIGGTFDIALSPKEIKTIQLNGFTQKTLLPIIKKSCDQNTKLYSQDSSELMGD